ncbi:MAG: hypothetical protein LKE46_07765 [Clostridium sp.]|jgi:hypothetical protein|uniref:hypothetical protein n=1 Tax=Clostridium sp. TaxID=1506 RepID=UPI0025BE11BA|nr:hypothetical protein [Clostridium sp.]MCH3964160.1 hypothetical protein [Clostridium sp.]MCI1715341.1 hypothetical protein [Clostridium sp.]MCI1799868.1 hypothetical protein [Clostridium sp.]MCI1813524.1 hypothetical protein [Clostridium sp.]MCI1870686.1 hypothetical protein [Clostridium sp.]
MEHLKYRFLNNIKYKSILSILLAILVVLMLQNTITMKNMSSKKSELYILNKNIYSLETQDKVDYSKMIDSLKQIKDIDILNFESSKEKNKITSVIETEGNDTKIQNILEQIEAIDKFHSIDSITISEFNNKNKNMKATIYVSFQ